MARSGRAPEQNKGKSERKRVRNGHRLPDVDVAHVLVRVLVQRALAQGAVDRAIRAPLPCPVEPVGALKVGMVALARLGRRGGALVVKPVPAERALVPTVVLLLLAEHARAVAVGCWGPDVVVGGSAVVC